MRTGKRCDSGGLVLANSLSGWRGAMVVLRILGFILIAIGLILSITIVLIWLGIPMMLLGLLFVLVGKKRAPIIIQMQQQPPPGNGRG